MTKVISNTSGAPGTSDLLSRPVVSRAVDFALSYVGVGDGEAGKRAGFDIDAWASEFNAPLTSSWDAIVIAKARKEGRLWIPHYDVGLMDDWFYEAQALGLATDTPVPGAVVLYASSTTGLMSLHGAYRPSHVVAHMGLVACTHPRVMSIERHGRSCRGCGKRERALSINAVDPSRVLCFVKPGEQKQAAG